MTVPLPFIPLTTTSKVVPLFGAISVMVTFSVPGALPLSVISSAVKVVGLIGLLKIAMKRIELLMAGSVYTRA
ncbi:hypothetical protein [Chloroflexus sp.]|uniref:hypothetical protein n=1 Tax=Chloroflexus sp. TaxID=1904827 RepID=UPI002ADE6EB6|nr:hypothetical protein [Chloroflexus sp.]